MPWDGDTSVPTLHMRKGRLSKIKERQYCAGSPRENPGLKNTYLFTLLWVLCFFFFPCTPLVFKKLFRLTYMYQHQHSGHYVIAKGFQGKNICVRDFAYVEIFPRLFILARTKPISFAAIVTVYAFNKFHVLHAVDEMLLYARMPIKSLKTISLWINITLKGGEGKVLFILKFF